MLAIIRKMNVQHYLIYNIRQRQIAIGTQSHIHKGQTINNRLRWIDLAGEYRSEPRKWVRISYYNGISWTD